MISKKTKYALKALFYLSKKYKKGSVLISNLAHEEKIPKKFLEAILLELKNQGILQSKKGKGGGYTLGKPPEEITMGQVVRLLDGPLAPVSCASKSAYERCVECKSEENCEIRTIMKEVRDAISNILDKTSLSDAILKTGNIAQNYNI
jgi:Rrf2 family protein